jgi:PIN domain nuclease of toxin-antitoxin system
LRQALEREDLAVSPMVALELQYLYEIGRVSVGGAAVVEDLRSRIGLRTCDKPFPEVVSVAHTQAWTRDPFDRIIVAQAALTGSLLVTKDGSIREHYPHALWPEG